MTEFNGKVLLITGGTGSFGQACLDRFLETDIGEIRIYSRDEAKQDHLRHIYVNDKIKYYIGDIRDRDGLRDAMDEVDYVFHAAALKEVPSCEFFPMEAVRTNIIGTDNVLRTAVEADVKSVVCLSTDKAAYPINAMGMTKALMEKTLIAKARTLKHSQTLICGTRYGNVMNSRGSVIPLFFDQAMAGKPFTVTDAHMTRFLMSLPQAIDLVMYAFHNASPGDMLVNKAPASTIGDLAQAVKELTNSNSEIKFIGKRHGEKMYEVLVTEEEMAKAYDEGDYYRIPADSRDLNYDKYFVEGETQRNSYGQFNSDNARRLNVKEVKELLLTTEFVQKMLAE